MEPQRDLAIVLRVVPFEERHRIVTGLTENHGLLTAMARNSVQSRRFGGTLDLFAASEWLFVQKPRADLARLEEASIRRSYEGLRRDFERLSMASVMNELVLKVAPFMDPCPELFRLHANALARLEELESGTEPDLVFLNTYFAKLLQWNGSQPRLDACRGCQVSVMELGADASLSGGVADAGWICPACRERETRHLQGGLEHSQLRISPAAVRDLILGLNLPIGHALRETEASRLEHRELFRFLEALFVHHLPGFDGASLKGLRFLDLESRPPLRSGYRR